MPKRLMIVMVLVLGLALLPTVALADGQHSMNGDPDMAHAGSMPYMEHPGDPQEGHHESSDGHHYFSQTGHDMADTFFRFWERHGGVPMFGYPMDDEHMENGRTVQYMERQRFEHHPEFAGAPYEVMLGRMGHEDAAHHGLLDTAPFRALPADTGSDMHTMFFTETGHRLGFGFRQYWEAQGLDFGDPGVSYRESLALFGYPISEEFVDPASGLTVQYFERARFEFHPDNPEPYRILLGRLGAEDLAHH